MVNLTKDDIIRLNRQLQEHFKIRTGIQKRGLLNSIVERPEQTYREEILYPDIYLKAASIFEGLARWHVFSDLNKRTALITTRAFLDVNGYVFVVPLSAVRFSVKVADDQNTYDEYTQHLIRKIAMWIKKYTGSRENTDDLKRAIKNASREVRILAKLYRFKLDPIGNFLLSKWLAFDIYPEYKIDTKQVLFFIREMQDQSFDDISDTFKQ